jgi:hypothetical protein
MEFKPAEISQMPTGMPWRARARGAHHGDMNPTPCQSSCSAMHLLLLPSVAGGDAGASWSPAEVTGGAPRPVPAETQAARTRG